MEVHQGKLPVKLQVKPQVKVKLKVSPANQTMQLEKAKHDVGDEWRQELEGPCRRACRDAWPTCRGTLSAIGSRTSGE